MHLQIYLEEPSMQPVIESILRKLFPDTKHQWTFHPYFGKQNLLKRLPQLLRAYSRWKPDDYRFIIIIDQDQDDCYQLKQAIVDWCVVANLQELTLVRVVVTMLESWFLGDASALEAALPKIKKQKIGTKSIYRQPESRPYPADDLDREMKEAGYDGYFKLTHSTQIAPHLSIEPEHNRCHSFHVTVQGLQTILDS